MTAPPPGRRPRQGDGGNQPVDDEADREGGQEHEGNREHRDGLHLAPEVHGRHTHGAENSSGGSTISRMRCGSISMAPTCGRNPIAKPTTSRIRGDATRTLGAMNWHATMMSIPATAIRRVPQVNCIASNPTSAVASHYSGYARRELARRTTPRPHGLDTIPECPTDPHEQSTLYNRRIVSRRFS